MSHRASNERRQESSFAPLLLGRLIWLPGSGLAEGSFYALQLAPSGTDVAATIYSGCARFSPRAVSSFGWLSNDRACEIWRANGRPLWRASLWWRQSLRLGLKRLGSAQAALRGGQVDAGSGGRASSAPAAASRGQTMASREKLLCPVE